MQVTAKLGQTVTAEIQGHSALNGALIPADATVTMTSNDPTAATVPATVPVPAGGAQEIQVPVTLVATGVTDIGVAVKTADGSIYAATATLLIEPAPQPGLVSVSLDLLVE